MYVFSFHRWADVGDFDPDTGTVAWRPRVPADEGVIALGHVADLDGVQAVFYRDGEHLSLRLGGERFAATKDNIRRVQDDDVVTLVAVRSDGTALPARYVRDPMWPPLPGDYTWAEAEDFDFALFVVNVLADEGRSRRLYRGAAES